MDGAALIAEELFDNVFMAEIMFGGVFSFSGELHEVTQSNDSTAKTENAIFNPILVFIIL